MNTTTADNALETQKREATYFFNLSAEDTILVLYKKYFNVIKMHIYLMYEQ